MFESLKYNLKHNRRSVMKQAAAWVFFSAIILVFVFFGMTPQQMSPEGGTVAVVNKSPISLAQMGEMTERMRRDPRFQQFQALGGDFGNQILEQQALNQLIEMELVHQETQDERLWTTDAEVRQTIMEIPAFVEDGRFRNDVYRQYLAGTNKTPSEFEGEIRRERALRRTVELFRTALQPLAIETARQKQLSDMKANVEFVTVPTETLVIPESVKQAEVQAFLADPANEKRVRENYDSRKADFTNEEMVKARHILVSIPEGADGETKALEKVNNISKQLKDGADFAKLAKENSDDPGSKAQGGDLGFFPKGRMVPEFDKAAFSQNIGEVSQPIKTQFGYHLLQVQEKKAAGTRPFEEVREEIAGNMIAKDRSKAALTALEEALKAGNMDAVNKFIAEHKLKWEETGAFSIDAESVPKLGSSDEVIKAAFALSPEKPMAQRLVRTGPTAYIVRHKAVPAEKAPATPKQNDDPELTAAFTANRRSEDALRSWMEALRKDATVTMSDRYARRATAPTAEQ